MGNFEVYSIRNGQVSIFIWPYISPTKKGAKKGQLGGRWGEKNKRGSSEEELRLDGSRRPVYYKAFYNFDGK